MSTDKPDFWTTLESIDICMVTTTDDGDLRARPMAPYLDRNDGKIRFMTDRDSAKVIEMAEDPMISLTFADNSKMVYVSVTAHAKLTTDPDLIDEMWGPYAKVFFGGPESGKSDAIVIEATPLQAEIWDNSGSKLAMAAEMGRAYFSDDGPNLGTNAKYDFADGAGALKAG